MTDKVLCIYHGNCADGFGAAWVIRRFFGEKNVEFFAAKHGGVIPEVSNREVVMVDFSYKRPVLEEFAQRCSSLLILDHHKSARDDLSGVLFTAPPTYDGHLDRAARGRVGESNPIEEFAYVARLSKVSVLFDMERSGAVLAWNYFFPNEEVPLLLQHVQDRDLWRFRMHDTRDISALIFSYPYDFGTWDSLISDCAVPCMRARMAAIGHALQRKLDKDITELLPQTTRMLNISGCLVPVANLPYTMASEAAGRLAKDYPFAACYYDGPDGRNWSLRSTEDGMDVAEIAKLYGGGGHAHAAGFRTRLLDSEEDV